MALNLQRRSFLQLAMGTAAASVGAVRAHRIRRRQRCGDHRLAERRARHGIPTSASRPMRSRSSRRSSISRSTRTRKLKLIPHLIKSWNLAPDGLEHGGRTARRRDLPQRRQDDDGGFPLHLPRAHQVRHQARHRAIPGRRSHDIVIELPTKATMKFNSPAPTAPQWMAFLGSYVVPKKYIESQGLDNFLKKPIGTGPYKLAEYELNSRIVLERNDKYWGPKPKIARVTIEIIKDPSARVAAIQSGQVDLHPQCSGPRGRALRQGSRRSPPRSIRSRA